jgi:hypothetical protein
LIGTETAAFLSVVRPAGIVTLLHGPAALIDAAVKKQNAVKIATASIPRRQTPGPGIEREKAAIVRKANTDLFILPPKILE